MDNGSLPAVVSENRPKVRVSDCSLPEWDAQLGLCQRATFFHSPEWLKIWSEHKGLEFGCLRAETEGGATAYFPFLKAVIQGIPVCFSGYRGYGGLLGAERLDEGLRLEMYRAFLSRFDAYQVRGCPISGSMDAGFFKGQQEMSWVIDLSTPFTLSRISKSKRSDYRCCSNAGLRVREIRSKSDVEAFLDLYKTTLDRWKTPKFSHDVDFLNQLIELPNEQVTLWGCFRDNQLLVAYLCAYSARHVHMWLAAQSDEARRVGAAIFLLKKIAEDAERRGLRWFDLGLASKRGPGINQWKESMGGVLFPMGRTARNPASVGRAKQEYPL